MEKPESTEKGVQIPSGWRRVKGRRTKGESKERIFLKVTLTQRFINTPARKTGLDRVRKGREKKNNNTKLFPTFQTHQTEATLPTPSETRQGEKK